MTSIIQRAAIAIGFIVTGLFLTTLINHSQLTVVKNIENEIFHTNCLLLFAQNQLNLNQDLPQLPSVCFTIDWLLPASLITNGLLVVFFGLTLLVNSISILNLVAFICLYTNPKIDSSFAMLCIFAFILITLKQGVKVNQWKSNKN